MVLVYDKDMDRWSDHSEPSEPVEIANSNINKLHENLKKRLLKNFNKRNVVKKLWYHRQSAHESR